MADIETVSALRMAFDDLREQLEADGICIKRECMCETAAPVVAMNALIAKLERECTPETTSTAKPR
jgi:hypothetical protein